ncbi:MAG: DUF1905 domain-containing protein [Bacteroidota bacterium]
MKSSEQPVTFDSAIHVLTYLMGVKYIEIPPVIVKQLGGSFSQRVICTINQKISFQAGFVSLGNGSAYISVNQARLKKLGVEEGDMVSVSLVKDDSEYGVPMPEELDVLFQQDREGFDRFKGLAMGMQRYIMNHVSAVKNTQKRVDRAILLITNLKKTKKGKETFRAILGKDEVL